MSADCQEYLPDSSDAEVAGGNHKGKIPPNVTDGKQPSNIP